MSIQSEINRLKNNVAATYAAMEEQGATMPTQQNSANMAATARTIPTGSGGGTTVQADWSVNNPSNARYVKNRTHWKEVFDGPEGEVISETEVSFTSNIKTVTGAMSDAIQVGGLYVVSWNGTDYECVGKSGSDGNYIGNGSFMNAGNMTFEDTGEPFCVLLFGGTYYQLWKGDTTAETITVKVVGKKETVWHKLDSRFLNEALQFGAETKVILPETTSEVVAEMEGAPIFDVFSVEVGKTYAVTWNGTKYVCTAQAIPSVADVSGAILGNSGAIAGGVSTGEPFVIMCLDASSAAAMGVGGLAAPLDGSESITLSIILDNITKLDSKYLNEALQFGETVITSDTLTWDGDTDGLVCVEIDVGVVFCKVSDSVVTRDDCANGIVVTVGVEDIPFPGEDIQAMFSDDGFCCIDAFAFVPYGNYFWTDTGMTFPEAGVYFIYADGMFISKLAISGYSSFVKREVKKLDNKYLDLAWKPSKKPATRVEVFPETTVESTGKIIPLTEEFMASAENEVPYIVTWNGTEYICNALLLANQLIIGNLSMTNLENAPNTGEPFLFLTVGQHLNIIYTGEGPATFKIDRGYYDTLPYAFAPASYTIPTELKATGSNGNGSEMERAEYVLRHGGKVYGTVDGKSAEILAVRADSMDNWHFFSWRILEGMEYGDIYTRYANYAKSMSPAVDREEIFLRLANSQQLLKRFRFFVDNDGNLMSANEDGTNQKSYMTATPVTSADNGKFLRVVDGAWAAVALTDVSEVGA